MKKAKINLFLATLTTIILAVTSASALPLLDGINLLRDSSGEYLVDNGDQDGLVGVGDYLIGDMVFDRINSTVIGNEDYSELTAHFEIEVLTAVQDATTGWWNYTFGAIGTNTEMAWFYIDDTPDATTSNPSSFSDGSLWASFGINSSNSQNFWTASTDTNNIAQLANEVTVDPSGNHGIYNFQLDVIQNNSGLIFSDVGITGSDLVTAGNGSFTMPDPGTDYHIGDQATLMVNVVPEPTTFVLLGFGLLGLTGIGRRKK